MRVVEHQDAGFTILEVMFASIVLAIAAVGLAAGLAQGGNLTTAVKQEIAARNAARGMLAEIGASPFDTVAALYNDQDFEVPGLSAAAGDVDGKCGGIAFAYGPAGETNLYRVSVEVTWRHGNGSRTVVLDRYLANVRGDSGTPAPLATPGGTP